MTSLPAAVRPVFVATGSPASILPTLGPPWHGYMVEGEATDHELSTLTRRLAGRSCVAMGPHWWLRAPPPAAAAARRLRPKVQGALFTTYGCAALPAPARLGGH